MLNHYSCSVRAQGPLFGVNREQQESCQLQTVDGGSAAKRCCGAASETQLIIVRSSYSLSSMEYDERDSLRETIL